MSATLLLDMGNSRLKWALAAPGLWRPGGSVAYGDHSGVVLDRSFASLAAPARVVAASVATEDCRAIVDQWLRRRWGLVPEFIQAQPALLGVTNGYREPARLGADRWAALIGAWRLGPGAACVVDCGTAVTIDALSAGGEFAGGVILPGLALARSSLAARAAGIAPTEHGDASDCLARATADAVAAGTLFGLAGAIERVVREQRAIIGRDAKVILTGGDAAALLPSLPWPAQSVPDLVLQGLAHIAGLGASLEGAT